jgi:hypothetical protein
VTDQPRGLVVGLLLSVLSPDISAGEIAGIPSQAPPFLQRDLEINFSNDFLGRGGSVDDFRTQQINVTGRIGNDWLALIDHSILTLGSSNPPGRLDQLSASLGYQAINIANANSISRVVVGGGLRSSGNFAGARMQNGFHQLIGSDIVSMDYVGTERTDATVWLDAEVYRSFHESGDTGFFGGWRSGYWLRGNSLLTTDGQWDNAVGAYAVSSKKAFDIWLGLRQDWRSGYDRDAVQAATAAAESELAIVLGIRFGALILETVQQPNGNASYGQLKFFASGKNAFPRSGEWPRIGIELAFILPDVHIELAGKYRSSIIADADSPWSESLLLGVQYGQPQFGDDTSLFLESRQLTLGIEWQRQLSPANDWISCYGALSGGYRTEQLRREGTPATEESDSVGRAVVSVATGFRFNAASLSQSWMYRLQVGISAWLPLSDADVQLSGSVHQIQSPALGISLGMTFDYQ